MLKFKFQHGPYLGGIQLEGYRMVTVWNYEIVFLSTPKFSIVHSMTSPAFKNLGG